METYKLLQNGLTQQINSVQRLSDMASIPFAQANTDYQQFKSQVLAGATLEDADGNPMTQEQANEFIATLP